MEALLGTAVRKKGIPIGDRPWNPQPTFSIVGMLVALVRRRKVRYFSVCDIRRYNLAPFRGQGRAHRGKHLTPVNVGGGIWTRDLRMPQERRGRTHGETL